MRILRLRLQVVHAGIRCAPQRPERTVDYELNQLPVDGERLKFRAVLQKICELAAEFDQSWLQEILLANINEPEVADLVFAADVHFVVPDEDGIHLANSDKLDVAEREPVRLDGP